MPDSLVPLYQWQSSGLGRALIGAETRLLSHAFDDVFGLELLQLGAWGSGRELLAVSRIRRQSVVAEKGAPAVGPDLIASLTHLPIAGDSIDAVLMPHTLELASDPHAVLREADRVLGGEGKILILGFRPMSLWGLRAAAQRAGFPPGLRRTLSEGRIRDWLVLLGYDIIGYQSYLYRLPTVLHGAPQDAVDRMLHRGWLYPLPGAAYLIKARKRLYTLTPIRPKLRERLTVLGGRLVEPSAGGRAIG
jgi:SAM-dependent methyltransferase